MVKLLSSFAFSLNLRRYLEGSVKSTKLKLTWLPKLEELVPLKLVDFDYLITKKKVRRCKLTQ